MIKTITSVVAVLTTFTALAQSTPLQVIIESRLSGGGVNTNPPYQELVGPWLSSTLKSTASGLTSGIGSRFATNGVPAFAVKPTLLADRSYWVEVTHGSASSIPTNLLATVSSTGGSGLPAITDVFARSNANTWEMVGMLTLDPGVTEPEVTFTYGTNQPAPNTTTRRFYADAVRFTEVTTDPPQIVSDPVSQTNLAGTTATFSVSATGTAPLFYRWRKDGVPLFDTGNISGTGSTSLVLNNVSLSSIGSYDVSVSNSYGTVVSAPAILEVTNAPTVPPGITTQPQSQSVLAGQTVLLWVEATGTSLSYQWFKDGIMLTNSGRITGATDPSLVLSNSVLSDAGNYTVTVSNSEGSIDSDIGVVTVTAAPPVITTQPQSQTITVGQSVALSVGATGTSPLTYHWSKNGIALTNTGRISGTTSSFLIISNAFLSDAGSYRVTVANSVGSTNSDVAILTVNAVAPSITSQPQSKTVIEGQNASFAVTVSGTAPFAYQWAFNGTAIPGGTSSSFTVVNAQASNQGSYTVTVTNSAGSVTSAAATLTVTPFGSLVIVESMVSSNVVNSFPPYGEVAGIWVTSPIKSTAPGVTAGVGSRFGTNTSPAFVVKPTLIAGGTYSVAVTHGLTSTIPSNLVANVTVVGGTGLPSTTTAFSSLGANTWITVGTLTLDETITQPEIKFTYASNQVAASSTRRFYADAVRFVLATNPPSIVSQPVSQTNLAGATVTFNASITGATPLTYSWRKGGTPLANGGNITGASTSKLTISGISSSDEGAYDLVVTNSYGLITSSPAILVVTNPVAPGIVTQPQNRSVAVGATPTFQVVANGTGPLAYRWSKDGTTLTDDGRITGTGSSLLRITNAVLSDAGSYTVTVSNSVGTVTSDAATLSVLLPPVITAQPAPQVVLEGQNATFVVSATGSALNYQWSRDGVDIPGANGDTLTILNVQFDDQRNYRVRITNAVGTVFSVFAPLNISAPGAVVVESKMANGTNTPAPFYQEVGTWIDSTNKSSAPGLTGINSRFLVSSNNGAFVVVPTLPTPGGMYAVEITHGTSLNIPSTNLFADVSAVGGSGLPAVTTAFVASSSNVWRRVGIITLDAGVTQPEIRFAYSTNQLPASGTRRFYADGIRFIEIPTPPVITVSPVDQAVILGSDVTFNVAATGTAPLSYQWQKDGVALPAASQSTLTIAAVQPSDAAVYSVEVSNSAGSVLSAEATLVVNIPATIITAPVDQELIQGQNASFVVTAAGDAPLNYQWQFNGVDIAGATTSVLGLNNVIPADAGSYTVIVTNAYGSASATATLVVDVPPAIVVQPVDVTVAAGESFNFSVTATGTEPLHYQWQFNGNAIPGATDATLSGNSDAFNGGYYRVIVSNVAGTVTSDSAKLIKPIAVGLYNGLFYEADQVRHETSGALRMDLLSSGSFTGKVSVAGRDYRFSGTFSDVHQATVSVPRPNATPLTLDVRLLTANQNDEAVGTISSTTWSADLLADRAFYSTNNPPPQVGEYTLALVGDSNGVTSPGGSGVGSVSVGMDGSVNLHGALLSDNTGINQNVPLSRTGHWPVYVSLYGGAGSLLGWMRFENTDTSSLQGTLSWINQGVSGSSYTSGFTNEISAIGSIYLYPPATPGVLDLTNMTMTLSGSSLNASLDFLGTIPVLPNNKIESVAGSNQLKLKIKDSGRITGTLLWAPTGELLPVNGIVLQQDRTARGFFIAPDKTTGSFLLRAP